MIVETKVKSHLLMLSITKHAAIVTYADDFFYVFLFFYIVILLVS